MDAKQLKDSILQYAMQGKLVPQDPNDEPAIELLKRIKEEKEQLIAQNVIKKEKDSPEITEGEIPFEIPESWEWVRASNILDVRDGTHDTPKYVPNGIPLVTSKNLKDGKLIMEPIKYISLEDHELIKKRSKVDAMDILFAMIGSIGNPVLIQDELEFSIKNVGLFKSMPTNKVNMEYIYNYLLFAESGLRREASGAVQSFVSLSKLRQLLIPLPPLKEQKRLVEKIKELSLKWERYESLHESIITLDDELPSNLEKSILQYAMQGKLVGQDSTDEPVSKLIERIKLKKEELIKNRIIKKEKDLPEITEEEIPFDIPESWEWVRLGEISTILNGFAFKSGTYVEKSKNQLIRLGNVKNSGLLLEAKPAYISDEIAENANGFLLKKNDILVTMTGTKGKRDYFYTCKVSEEDIVLKNLYLNQRVGCIRAESILSDFLNYALKAEIVKDTIFKHETGTANQGNIGIGAIRNLLIPLPPIEEQVRITRKIEIMRVQLAALK